MTATKDFVEREHLGLHWRLGGAVGQAIAQGLLWQPEATQALARVVRPGMHVLDGDGSQLWFTLLLARLVGPSGRVVACVAEATAREQLHWHLQRNHLVGRVHVLPGRVSALAAGAAVGAVLPVRFDVARLEVADGDAERDLGAPILRRCRPVLLLHRGAGRDSLRLLGALRRGGYEVIGREGAPFATDEQAVEFLDDSARPCVQARPVAALAGVPTVVASDVDELRGMLGLGAAGRILEDDIDVVENECERFGRKRRDAEVLTTLAANCDGSVLELGTSHGQGTFKLASNLNGGVVHTVNVLPHQVPGGEAGRLVTHLLSAEEIGSFYRARGVANVRQIFANTRDWRPPAELKDLGMVFIDACHDADAVRADSELCWPLLRPGGFLVWHDWSPFARACEWIESVMLGAAAFMADQRLTGPVVHLRGSWTGVLRKNG